MSFWLRVLLRLSCPGIWQHVPRMGFVLHLSRDRGPLKGRPHRSSALFTASYHGAHCEHSSALAEDAPVRALCPCFSTLCPYCTLRREATVGSRHGKSKFCPSPSGEGICVNYLEFPTHLSFLPYLFIYLLIYLFICLLACRDLYIGLQNNTALLYFIVEIVPALAPVSLTHPSLWGVLSTSLPSILHDTPDSSSLFLALIMEPGISPRSPGLISWRTILQMQIWALLLVPNGRSLLLGPCSS